MKVLEVNNVHKSIGKREIIKGISFSVNEGEIFGFLGPNGAGKTTTIRMIVGLIGISSGSIYVFGKDVKKDKVEALRNIGCVVENPDMYGYLTGRQNLIQYARMYGNIPKERIDEIANIVGLSDRIDDKVRKYSLGMKQRLGLGQALLSNPKLLILDEPTNGLDPVGIMELRNLIKKIAHEEKTAVFISSHNLMEIEQTCDTFAVIDKGIIKSVETVNNSPAKQEKQQVSIVTAQIEKCIETLKSLSYIENIQNEDNRIDINIESGSFPKLIKALVLNDIEIINIFMVHKTLEDRFMEIVEGEKKNV